MSYVEFPFVGYRLQPAYAHLLPECDERPDQYCLSAIYTCEGVEGYTAARDILNQSEDSDETKKYPGSH